MATGIQAEATSIEMGDQSRSNLMHNGNKDIQFAPRDNSGDAGQATIEIVLKILSIIFLVLTFPVTIWESMIVVRAYEQPIVLRFGRLKKRNGGVLEPGISLLLPWVDKCYRVDMRTLSFCMPKQDILSKDSVTVELDAYVFFRVVNPKAAILNVQDYLLSTQMLAVSTLRNVLGTKNFTEILSQRESIGHLIESALAHTTHDWGVQVLRVEIRDAFLPVHMRRAMAAEAEATQEARAKVINAEGEHKASEALRDAARVLESSPQAIQLRYLQTLNTIAAEKNSTIIFPLPIELFGSLMGHNNNRLALAKSLDLESAKSSKDAA